MKLVDFIKFKIKDIKKINEMKKLGQKPFKKFGLTLFTGRQGAGKTMSLVYEAEKLREEFPNLYIASNFGYIHQNEALTSLADITNAVLRARDLECVGVLILWDEIQNDFDAYSKVSKDVLRVITQQRKQGIKILATSQVFNRVSKALREQTYEVAICNTILQRYTRTRYYDADEYAQQIERSEERRKLHRLRTVSFVQSDELRELYDSYAVIKSLSEKAAEEKKNPQPNVLVVTQ